MPGAPDRLDQLDYYTLLGLQPGASADEIREAYHAFALRFHPDRHIGGEGAKIMRAATIFRRGAEAYRVLLDPGARRLYDQGLAEGRLRLDSEAVLTSRGARASRVPGSRSSGVLQVKSIKARPFVRKAEQAIKAEDWKTARLNLRVALTHEPGNERLEARLAQVESALGSDRG